MAAVYSLCHLVHVIMGYRGKQDSECLVKWKRRGCQRLSGSCAKLSVNIVMMSEKCIHTIQGGGVMSRAQYTYHSGGGGSCPEPSIHTIQGGGSCPEPSIHTIQGGGHVQSPVYIPFRGGGVMSRAQYTYHSGGGHVQSPVPQFTPQAVCP